jgi:hypothetical protein
MQGVANKNTTSRNAKLQRRKQASEGSDEHRVQGCGWSVSWHVSSTPSGVFCCTLRALLGSTVAICRASLMTCNLAESLPAWFLLQTIPALARRAPKQGLTRPQPRPLQACHSPWARRPARAHAQCREAQHHTRHSGMLATPSATGLARPEKWDRCAGRLSGPHIRSLWMFLAALPSRLTKMLLCL